MERLTKRIVFPDGSSTVDFSNEMVGKFLTAHEAEEALKRME